MRTLVYLFMVFCWMHPCLHANKEKWIEEIRMTETVFCETAEKAGLQSAFLEFAADTAVLKRGDKLIEGKPEIAEFYRDPSAAPGSSIKLQWSPTFIDVSDDGTLGYTFGAYTYSQTDPAGVTKTTTGIFHTVWKRQSDGTWKYVWD